MSSSASRGRHDPPPPAMLLVFEAAARHRSFKLAAAELGVTPGAVSHRAKALERGVERTIERVEIYYPEAAAADPELASMRDANAALWHGVFADDAAGGAGSDAKRWKDAERAGALSGARRGTSVGNGVSSVT